jgi:hypothetical protein
MVFYGSIYIDNIQKYVVVCLIIKTTFPFDAGSRVDIVRHTSGYLFYVGSSTLVKLNLNISFQVYKGE